MQLIDTVLLYMDRFSYTIEEVFLALKEYMDIIPDFETLVRTETNIIDAIETYAMLKFESWEW